MSKDSYIYSKILRQSLIFILNNKIFEGKGVINRIINKLPFQIHLPGHNYTGPGTNLYLNMEKNIAPINKVDEAAFIHDNEYSINKTDEARRISDEKLIEKAREIFNDKNSTLKEKTEAFAVEQLLEAKNFFGGQLAENKDLISITNKFKKFLMNDKNIKKIVLHKSYRDQLTDLSKERLIILGKKYDFSLIED